MRKATQELPDTGTDAPSVVRDRAPAPPPRRHTDRQLTAGEISLVRSVFGEAIRDLDRVEIRHRRFIFFQPSGTTMAPNGHVYLAQDLWRVTDFSHEPPHLQALLIHEMAHVWQHQTGMHVIARGLFSAIVSYDYVLCPGRPFARYPMEQQATIVEDFFRSLQGVTHTSLYRGPGWRAILPPAAYEALIPWLKDRPREEEALPTLA